VSDLLRELLFYLVVLLTHIIQGITGFAGTILAMPFSLKLVGMDVAVPVLNMLGLVSGIYVTAGSYKHIERGELKRILLVMGSCVLIGLGLRSMLSGKPQLLYYILGVSILAIAVHGIWGMLRGRKQADSGVKTAQAGNEPSLEKNGSESADFAPQAPEAPEVPGALQAQGAESARSRLISYLTLAAAGLVHGMFVCGGPLLIAYLTKRVKEKEKFRATISVVWIFLNGVIFITQLIAGAWNPGLWLILLKTTPFFFGGMAIGSRLYKHMSQQFFIGLTYVLLFIAGLTLFFK